VNALDQLLFHLRQMIDGNYLPLEDAARYLGTNPTTLRELLAGEITPSDELAAEIEALSKSYLSDPAGRFARGLSERPRGVRGNGEVRVFDLRAERLDRDSHVARDLKE
jgi:hypothetical protein